MNDAAVAMSCGVVRGETDTPATRGRVAECVASRSSADVLLSTAGGQQPPRLCLTWPAPLLRLTYPRDQIIVRRVGALFIVRAFRRGQQINGVAQARDAQAVVDYVASLWPPGTKINWIIQPPFSARPATRNQLLAGVDFGRPGATFRFFNRNSFGVN